MRALRLVAPAEGLMIGARGACSEHYLVEITAGLAADLTCLTESLDDPAADIADSMRQMANDAKLAVRSYLGMAVVTTGEHPVTLTGLEDSVEPDDILTSLWIPFPSTHGGPAGVGPSLALILYGGKPGAFIDLAADLAWLTGRDLIEFALDDDLTVPDHAGELSRMTLINQALGMLIGRGRTPEQAQRELHAEATRTGDGHHMIAGRILARLGDAAPEPV